MPGIDRLISYYLSSEIKNNLKNPILTKLEHELFFEEGMSIKLSIEYFEKFHNHLKKIADFNLTQFEVDCIKKILKVKKIKNGYNLKIVDPNLGKKIFNYFGDSESREILNSVMGTQKTIKDILEKSKISKSPAYRKIENLVIDGLMFESGKILRDAKRISCYSCIFEEITIFIKKDKITIDGIISNDNFNKSSITKTGLF